MLLSRVEFRKQVFARDKNTCVVPGCNADAVDPHHIMDRSLWLKDDPYPEGYLLENGVSVCETHHFHAEQNYISPEAFRLWLGLPLVLPRQLNEELTYDKWGEIIPEVSCEEAFEFLPNPADNCKALLGKPLEIITLGASTLRATSIEIKSNPDKTSDPVVMIGDEPLWVYSRQRRILIPVSSAPYHVIFPTAWEFWKSLSKVQPPLLVRCTYPFHPAQAQENVAMKES